MNFLINFVFVLFGILENEVKKSFNLTKSLSTCSEFEKIKSYMNIVLKVDFLDGKQFLKID